MENRRLLDGSEAESLAELVALNRGTYAIWVFLAEPGTIWADVAAEVWGIEPEQPMAAASVPLGTAIVTAVQATAYALAEQPHATLPGGGAILMWLSGNGRTQPISIPYSWSPRTQPGQADPGVDHTGQNSALDISNPSYGPPGAPRTLTSVAMKLDNLVEPTESFSLTIPASGTGWAMYDGQAKMLNFTMADVPPVVSISGIGNGREVAAGLSPQPGGFNLIRSRGDIYAPLPVQVNVLGGTAQPTDYAVDMSNLVLPAAAAGATEAPPLPVDVTPIDDNLVEPVAETVIVGIGSSPNTYVIGSPSQATITLLDNEPTADLDARVGDSAQVLDEQTEDDPGAWVSDGSVTRVVARVTNQNWAGRRLEWDHPDKVIVTDLGGQVLESGVEMVEADGERWFLVRATHQFAMDDEVTMTLTAGHGASAFQDTVRLVRLVDLDIDSDNTNAFDPPDRSAAEEELETQDDALGKVIAVNDDDTDADRIPDYAEGYNRDGIVYPTDVNGDGEPDQGPDDQTPPAGEGFVPVVLEVSEHIDLATATFEIAYSASHPIQDVFHPDPEAPYMVAEGALRLWKKDGDQARSVDDDYILPDTPYTAAQLGIGEGRKVTLYVEAVDHSEAKGDLSISVSVDLDGAGVGAVLAGDVTKLTGLDLDVLIGADDPSDVSLYDDWVGAQGHRIGNWVRLQGPPQFQLELELSARQPWGGPVSPVSIWHSDSTLTTDASGVASGYFEITGGYASARTEDVTVDATGFGMSLGFETMTVVQFSTEPETSGHSVFPANPVHVNADVVEYGGNLFAADVGSQNEAHDTDRPGRRTGPDLRQSLKIAPDKIEVVWARHITGVDGSLVTSLDDPEGIKVNPPDKGLTKVVAMGNDAVEVEDNSIIDRLRMRDYSFPAAFDIATWIDVRYYLGHPTSIKPELGIETNHAAAITVRPIQQRVYQVAVHVIDYVDPSTLQRFTTGVTVADVEEMLRHVNAVWSQVGISFVLMDGALFLPQDTTYRQEFDAVVGFNWTRTSTNDDVTAINNGANAIDLYIVNSIFVETNLWGDGVYDTGNTVLPTSSGTPGVLVAKTTGPGANDVRDIQGMARTMAHELGHYFLNNANHDARDWNLMVDGGAGPQRDLTEPQANAIRGSVVTQTNPDGQDE